MSYTDLANSVSELNVTNQKLVTEVSKITKNTENFLSPSATNPTTRDDGSSLKVGDRYFNTTVQAEYLYSSSGWKLSTATDFPYINLSNYSELRSYTGTVQNIQITTPGISGLFYYDNTDTTSSDNGGTIFVTTNGRRYKRYFNPDLGISILWFSPPTSSDALVQFNQAAAVAVSLQNGSSSASTPFVVVEGGTYTLSAATTGSVNWWLKPTGKFTTPTTVPGLDFSCERLTGTVVRWTGSNQFTTLIVGDPSMSPNRALTTLGLSNFFPAEIMGVSDNASGGVTGATRTGSRDVYDQATVGVTALAVNDNTNTLKPSYALYSEAVRAPNTGNANAAEMTIANLGNTYVDTPNTTRNATSGETYNLVLTSGASASSGAQNSTGAIMLDGKASGAYDCGIMFKRYAVPTNKAISLWENHRITWYGVGDQDVEREGVRVAGIVNTAEQGQLNLNVWDNPSTSWRGVSLLPSALYPTNDNVMSIGTASFRTSVVYSATGAIQTSDENYKTEIKDIDDIILDAWESINYCQYKFKDSFEEKGGLARLHFGLIAQKVKECFEKQGLDAFQYGLLCYDEWEDNGSTPAGSRYGIRYEEALVLECALLRRTTKNLEQRLRNLEGQ